MQRYQVDAFTDRLFAGNPAAVLVLDDWLPDRCSRCRSMGEGLGGTRPRATMTAPTVPATPKEAGLSTVPVFVLRVEGRVEQTAGRVSRCPLLVCKDRCVHGLSQGVVGG